MAGGDVAAASAEVSGKFERLFPVERNFVIASQRSGGAGNSGPLLNFQPSGGSSAAAACHAHSRLRAEEADIWSFAFGSFRVERRIAGIVQWFSGPKFEL